VEPDDVDAYTHDSRFSVNLIQIRVIVSQPPVKRHSKRMLDLFVRRGSKNDLEQIPDLVNEFDWALN
jgi:hypothetical protein